MSASKEFYDLIVDGRSVKYPRVTTILNGALNKPGLLFWAAWVERKAILAALEEVCTAPGEVRVAEVPALVETLLPRSRAFLKVKDEAADIGTQAHALIQWHTRKMLGLDVEVEPAVSDPALRCVLAWLAWTKEVEFTPLYAERIVYCARCCIAGTTDVVARVNGRVSILDYYSGKEVYPEKKIQTRWYQHLLSMSQRIDVEDCVVVRLPKYEDHPPLEAVPAPEIPLSELHAIATTWRLARRLDEATTGDLPVAPCTDRSEG